MAAKTESSGKARSVGYSVKWALVPLALLVAASGYAGEGDADSTLAFTFAYSPKTGAADLAQGYKKHLEWHVEKNDPILWYAWFVVQGDRVGHFVDGAYDVTGAEFDARPDPAGDAAHARENFSPVVETEYRRIYRLRRDLGTSSFLEERRPSPLMQVIYYHVHPGKQAVFETAASAIAEAACDSGIDYALYEMLTGADGALYAMYVPLQGFQAFDEPLTSLELVARSLSPAEELSFASTSLAQATSSTESEVWQYRSDLSLIPEER